MTTKIEVGLYAENFTHILLACGVKDDIVVHGPVGVLRKLPTAKNLALNGSLSAFGLISAEISYVAQSADFHNSRTDIRGLESCRSRLITRFSYGGNSDVVGRILIKIVDVEFSRRSRHSLLFGVRKVVFQTQFYLVLFYVFEITFPLDLNFIVGFVFAAFCGVIGNFYVVARRRKIISQLLSIAVNAVFGTRYF